MYTFYNLFSCFENINFIFFPITFILFISCNIDEVKVKTVKVNFETNESDIYSKVTIKSIVQLGELDSTPVGHITYIEYFLDQIYILDIFKSRAMFVFTKHGNLINKTKYGRGPDELVNPFAFFIDRNSDIIYVWDQAQMSMFKFDTNLNFISREECNVPMINFAKINENETLIHSHYDKDYTYKIYSADCNTKLYEFIPDLDYSGALSIFRSISIQDKIRLIAPYRYEVFNLIDNYVVPEIMFDFGKYQLTKEDVEKNGMSGCMNLIGEGAKVSGLNELSASEDFLLFHVYHKSETWYYAYSFENESIILLNAYFGKEKLPNCKIRGIIDKGDFYALVNPLDLKNFQDETNQVLVDGNIDINQNPYFMIFQLEE